MWRPSIISIVRKIVVSSLKENVTLSKLLYSTKGRSPRSAAKITMIGVSVGAVVGAGLGGYSHYKVNLKKPYVPQENEEYLFLDQLPDYTPHYKVVNEKDTSDLQLVLFQYRTCPFCCKVRAYLDARGISYEIVEVDAVLRQAIKWSGYKKVPILLVKTDGGYQQLIDSTAIVSILETYLRGKSYNLRDVIKFYPINNYVNDEGKPVKDITNKYFIMHNAPVPDARERKEEIEERKWREWADKVLAHTLSPNVYRTAGEALETFKWFEEAGGWRQAFPSWECALMVYGGAAAMWIISKRLKARHNITDARKSLYDAGNKWMHAVKQKGNFLGGDQPNLADITVYGVFSSIEGCQAFQDLRNHSDIGKWYDDIKNFIEQKGSKVLAVRASASEFM